MTTLSQLDKLADKWFNNQMRRRGFSVEKKFYFWRKRGPLFDVLWSEILSSGNSLRIHVTILSPWVDDLNGEFNEFPIATSLIGGTLSDGFPETMTGGQIFDARPENDIDATFKEILYCVDQNAIPWFNSVSSYDAYVSYLGRRGFHPTPEYRERIKQGIALGFEREPLP